MPKHWHLGLGTVVLPSEAVILVIVALVMVALMVNLVRMKEERDVAVEVKLFWPLLLPVMPEVELVLVAVDEVEALVLVDKAGDLLEVAEKEVVVEVKMLKHLLREQGAEVGTVAVVGVGVVDAVMVGVVGALLVVDAEEADVGINNINHLGGLSIDQSGLLHSVLLHAWMTIRMTSV